ncbi:50S ribosomal protein L11 methyltransferase [Limosilactobacillus sp.]|uniref:50S ribosomal protein L11 methyltransferase n=1 Tax=Limosilactobacillus sp. TaxID=2773925 RepID=UPI00345EC5B0
MEWTAVSVITTNEAVEAVSYILTDEGANGVQIDNAADYSHIIPGKYGKYGEIVDPETLPHREHGAAVTGYFPPKTFLPELVDTIKARVKQLGTFGLDYAPGTVKSSAIKDEQWSTVWQKYYHPVRVTSQLTVVPKWEEYQKQDPNEKLLVLDPGMAFGTGTHPTTKLMLQALEIVIKGGERLIDVGTGSGVLSIAAKQLGAGQVSAYDIDDTAVKSAKENIDLNPVAKDVELGVNSLLDGIHGQDADVIVANILAEIIVPLIPQAWENLKSGGQLLLSGIINDKLSTVTDALDKQGFILDESLRMKDWYGLIAHKPTADE